MNKARRWKISSRNSRKSSKRWNGNANSAINRHSTGSHRTCRCGAISLSTLLFSSTFSWLFSIRSTKDWKVCLCFQTLTCIFFLRLDLDPRASAAIWGALLMTLVGVLLRPGVRSMRMLFIAGILRSIYSVGLGPTLWLMGAIQVRRDPSVPSMISVSV